MSCDVPDTEYFFHGPADVVGSLALYPANLSVPDDDLHERELRVASLRTEVQAIEERNAKERADNTVLINRLRAAYDQIRASLQRVVRNPSAASAHSVVDPDKDGNPPVALSKSGGLRALQKGRSAADIARGTHGPVRRPGPSGK
jgi:hypothetical protein